MRIAIFGGSFNPIHTGHAIVANRLAQCGEFDQVWLMPGKINPFKVGGPAPAPLQDRIEMARLVARDCVNTEVCDIEAGLPEPSFTITALHELRRRYPQHNFRIVIGSDNWESFMGWKDWEEIIRCFGVTIYPRPGDRLPDMLPDNVTVLRPDDGFLPQIAVSSTMIRNDIAAGRNINFLVPFKVLEYVRSRGLYEKTPADCRQY